jgi:hypothetical protein
MMSLLPPALEKVRGLLGFGQEQPGRSEEEQAAAIQKEAQSRYQPNERVRRKIGMVERRYDTAKRGKESLLRIWATAIAFYIGEHYREWNPSTNQLVVNNDIPAWRVRVRDPQGRDHHRHDRREAGEEPPHHQRDSEQPPGSRR